MAAAGPVVEAQNPHPATDGYNPNPNSIVTALALQPDGKVLMGGYFTQIQPFGGPATGNGHIARVNPDGSVDTSFTPVAGDVVRTIVLQPNGQILIGGQFTTVQPSGSGTPIARNYVARLNADGSLDTVFNPNANGAVYAIAVQSNGQIIIGGSFTTVQPGGAASPITRNHVARFNVDGSLDTSFDPNTDRPVLALALQPNGQIVVGGGFSKLQPNGAAAATTRNCIARVNSDGSLDTGFDPEANGSVMGIELLPNAQIIICGEFLDLQPNGAIAPVQCDFVARLNSDGSLDTSFIVNPLSSVTAMAVQADGKLLIGGDFTLIFPQNSTSAVFANYVARINPDGSLDSTYNPSPDQAVDAIVVQQDGSAVLGGYFTHLQPADRPNAVPLNYIARVGPDGSVDATLAPDLNGGVYAAVQLSNGQVLVGGTFQSLYGASQSYLARLNANGTLDSSFAPTLNGSVQAIALESNGQILIGGNFTVVDGAPLNYMARLNADGSVDTSFNPSPNQRVLTITPLSSGQIIIGGAFTNLYPNGDTAGVDILYMARLNANGTVDETFVPKPGGAVHAMVIQPNGNLLVAGEFLGIAGTTQDYLARLLPTGAIDTSLFNPKPNAPVYALARQPNGQILIGGAFTSVEPQNVNAGTAPTATTLGTNTTITTPYGVVITLPNAGVSATVAIPINYLARLNSDGTLDTTFFPNPSSTVFSLALQSSGSMVVAGAMTSFAQTDGNPTGTIRNYIGLVDSNGSTDPAFNPDANGQVNTLSLLSTGQILVGGNFTTLQPNGASAATPENHVAILNADGSINPSFAADVNSTPSGQVNAMALQPNGQLLLGGSFGGFGGSTGSNLARFNPDGSPDTTYIPVIDGPVNTIDVEPNGSSVSVPSSYALWLQASGTVRYSYTAAANGSISAVTQMPNGQILVGGLFTSFDGVSGCQYLVRLNSDGTLDTTFKPGLNGQVLAVAVAPNGQIVVGGNFTMVGNADYQYLVRLNADGSLDTSFDPSPNLGVTCVAVQSNGQVLAGGNFTSVAYQQAIASTTTTTPVQASPRDYFARFNTNGAVDNSFVNVLTSAPSTIVILSNGKIMVGGAFTQVLPPNATAITRNGIAVFGADGALDATFNPSSNGTISAIAAMPNGQFVVGGTFTQFQPNPTYTTVNGVTTPNGAIYQVKNLARLNSDGTVDTTFNPDPNSSVASVALQANGQVIVGGAFTGFNTNGSNTSLPRYYIARINANGTVDTSFDTDLNAPVGSVAELQDGSLFVGGSFTTIETGGAILIGGSFANVDGIPEPHLAQLNADSTVNSTFTSTTDGPVNALAPQTDGKTLVGGSFNHIAGQAFPNLARLNVDTTLDTSFAPGPNGPVNAIAVWANGDILIGGAFTSVGGLAVTDLALLNPSGSPIASFAPAINGAVNAAVVLPSGQLVIGGSFTSVGGLAVGGVARLNADGSVDVTFNPNANGAVQAVTLQANGTLVVAGAFTAIGGTPTSYAARLLPNGAVDTTFNPSPNGVVNSVLAQGDGKIVLGGSFTSVGGQTRYDIARISTVAPVTQTLTASTDESTITWTLGGGVPAFAAATFEESTDGTNFTTVGQATSADGTTWVVSGRPPTGSSAFFVRATGVTPSSRYGSSGLLQTVALIYTQADPVITSAPQVAGAAGTAFSFTVTSSQSPVTYQASGLPPGLSINAATGVISGTPTAGGTYEAAVIAKSNGLSTSSILTISISSPASAPTTNITPSNDRLINLSSRDNLSGSQVMIGGFVVSGGGQKTLVLRAVGPGLAAFGVSGVMATPELELYSSSGTLIAKNSGWGGGGALSAAFAQVGAFALSPTSADAAVEVSLPPGAYTVQVFDPTGVGGVVLTEVYDADPDPLSAPASLINISARGAVSPGAGALIGGFVISGSTPQTVLIRGVGPGLLAYGVVGTLTDPVLDVYDSNGNLVASNTGWGDQNASGPDQVSGANIVSTDASVGAFALAAGSADTALMATLPPGAYTFQVTSASNSTGAALGEVYQVQ